MARLKQTTGLKTVIDNLNKELGKAPGVVFAGLKAGGLHLQRESQRMVPVDTGNLKASAFTRSTMRDVIVGYTSAYAPFVHEAPMTLQGQPRPTKGRYWDPQGRASSKFLETPMRTKKDEIAEIVRTVARATYTKLYR